MSAGGSAGQSGGTQDGSGSGDADATGTGGTALPPLPELTNLRVRVVGDAANLEFDPFGDAVDYRVYPLPPDDAIAIDGDGSVTIPGAIYRCAGRRPALYMLAEILNPEDGWNDNAAGGATVLSRDVAGYTRSEDEAELGHVYLTEADDRRPVYVLGDPDPANEASWTIGSRATFLATRNKRYVTDAATRDQLVAAGWRDDGIGFWVPRASGADTHAVYEAELDDVTLRWIDGPEAAVRGTGTVAFHVSTAADDDTVPLMRVHVVPYYSRAHDELVAGNARFRWVRRQADQPLPALRWAGLTGPTTLVAEALDGGCPYQGMLSPAAEAAFVDGTESHEAYVTPAQMLAASPTGEAFIDGQYDGDEAPRAIARSYVDVEPERPSLDVFATFPDAEDFRAGFDDAVGDLYVRHYDSTDFMLSVYNISHVHFGSMLGELWMAYNDVGAQINGMLRMTAHASGQVDADGFLYVTAEVDVVTTSRRFPQLLISDRPAPVQDAMLDGTTLVIGPQGYAPAYLDVQVCDHRAWDLNDPCAKLPVFSDAIAAPPRPLAELAGADTSVQLEVFLRSDRLYLRVDGRPFACIDLPAVADDGVAHGPPMGEVSVTWGDVLAHSAADFVTGSGDITAADSYAFARARMHTTARRHFDNLGFSSGVAAPDWDATRFPCAGG